MPTWPDCPHRSEHLAQPRVTIDTLGRVEPDDERPRPDARLLKPLRTERCSYVCQGVSWLRWSWLMSRAMSACRSLMR